MQGGVLRLVQASAGNFTKSNNPPWVFFTSLKIVQMVPNRAKCLISFKVKIVSFPGGDLEMSTLKKPYNDKGMFWIQCCSVLGLAAT